LRTSYGFLTPNEAHRLVRQYGTRAGRILSGARSRADLGRDFGAGLTAAEIDYLQSEEWARTAQDIVFRRTKLGLRLKPAQIAAIDEYLSGDALRAVV
jgi:glycerol-3-phosphate dehydrogenase